MILFFIIAFFFIPVIIHGKILFYADFEKGIVISKTKISPAQKNIVLIESSSPSEWLPDGGTGIIDCSLLEKTDLFAYEKRVKNRLIGCSGIKHGHLKWVELRTSHLKDWDGISNSEVFIDTINEYANYSAAVNVISGKYSGINKKISYMDTIWVQFSVIFDKNILANWKTNDFGFCWITPNGVTLAIDRVNNTHKFALNCGLGDTIYKISDDKQVIKPENKYKFKFFYSPHFTSGYICMGLWINSRKIGTKSIEFTQNKKADKFLFALGNPNQKKGINGRIFFDDIIISDSSIAPCPNRPCNIYPVHNGEIEKQKTYLISSPCMPVDSNDIHIASQWQISRENNWVLPLYNSGTDSMNLTRLELTDILLQKKEHYWRVRYCNSSGKWSAWSSTTKFSMNQENILNKPIVSIKNLIITDPHKGQTEEIIREKWYDAQVIMDNLPDSINLSYIDFWFHHWKNSFWSNTNRKAIKFNPENYYWTSLSVGDTTLWVKQTKNTDISEFTGLKKSFYVDGSYYKFDRKRGKINIRFKLLDAAKLGIWSFSAFVHTREGRDSPVFSKTIAVVSQLKAAKAYSRYYLPAMLISLILSFVIFKFFYFDKLRNKIKSRKINRIEALVEKGEYLSNDHAVKKAEKHILENYRNPDISIDQTSVHVGLNKQYLGKLFKNTTGYSYSVYLNIVRLYNAANLLHSSNKNISEIAFFTGYNSVEYFNNIFKKQYGMSPSVFRKNQVKEIS
ncbi:MAG: AraC family transcriptional regulator [bacterium]